MIYFTSDTHFNHARIIELANRPFKTVEEMNETIIRNWNARVREDDVVYHLGDFAMAPRDKIGELRSRLNGHIILVLGNHDYIRRGQICEENFEIIKKPLVGFVFDFVNLEDRPLSLEDLNRPVVLSHQPMEDPIFVFDQTEGGSNTYAAINLCGHVHGSWNRLDRPGWTHYNVGVDVRNFQPVTLEETLAATSFQKPIEEQHHPFKERTNV